LIRVVRPQGRTAQRKRQADDQSADKNDRLSHESLLATAAHVRTTATGAKAATDLSSSTITG
jgi:hypothetical protein